ncbi:YidC/Oxa1 family membrane protein insertase [Murdochiella massiliensis]|uniref:YidC/Oxa1 family membrane protein insertase n=1 Tax=Murdochiella massiliensis TaxID=1673723 RepID=UPI00083302D8|nr:YidC/Oxa1 family membrane protein insertase [Murdochiella massiliensis]
MQNIFSPLSDIFGWMMGQIYHLFANSIAEPAQVSYFALTILAMAVISKLITIPLMAQTTKASAKMQALGPKTEELKKKYGYDERILQQKTQELYKEEGVSMMGCSSCLPLLIQLMLIMALFNVLREPAKYMVSTLDDFSAIAKNFFWISDLLKNDPLTWFGLPLINAISQLGIQLFGPMRKQQQQMNKNMNMTFMLMPIMFYFISVNWAAGLLLYWVFGNILELLYRGIAALITRSKTHSAIEGGK